VLATVRFSFMMVLPRKHSAYWSRLDDPFRFIVGFFGIWAPSKLYALGLRKYVGEDVSL